MGRRGLSARRPCPVCRRTVAVSRGSERVSRHNAGDQLCPGSGQQIDLYEGRWPA